MVSKKQIEIAGKTISYLDEGDATQTPVLLLHGFPESSLLWADVIPAVKGRGFRAIAPDLPGFGESDRFTDGPSTWERYTEFLTDFLAALNVDRVHLFVHDWGGLIGLRWACEHEQRILSLFITDTNFDPTYTWHDNANLFRQPRVGEMVMSKFAENFHAFASQAIPGASQAVLDDFYRLFATAESRQVGLDLYRSGDMEKLVPYNGRLAAMQVPVTVVFGENDPFISQEAARKLHTDIVPQSTYHVIEGAGHFIHIEVPEKVRELVQLHFDKPNV